MTTTPSTEQAQEQDSADVIRADNQWIGDMMVLQVLADSDCPNVQEREVLNRWIDRSLPPSQRIERLKAAIEGECNGLAIDDAHARAILDYIDGGYAA